MLLLHQVALISLFGGMVLAPILYLLDVSMGFLNVNFLFEKVKTLGDFFRSIQDLVDKVTHIFTGGR